MNQQQNQLSYDTNQITGWVKGTKDPQVLSHIAREVFGQISQLDQNDRRQVFDTLRNDAKFSSVITSVMPQTA